MKGWSKALATLVLTTPLLGVPGCELAIDTDRGSGSRATLGDDVYGMLCDRIGAAAFSEDLRGESFHAICHFDAAGIYGDRVDTSKLPPVATPAAAEARRLSVAKLERLAVHRARLVPAINSALPDIDIPDPTTAEPLDTVSLHSALLTFSQDVTALYESNPYEVGGGPLMPMATEAVGRLFGAIENSDAARLVLQRQTGRQGYRPHQLMLGGARTLLSYPELRPLLRSQLEVLGPGGSGYAPMQRLLTAAKGELLGVSCELCALPALKVDASQFQPNRPRTAIEIGAELLLDEDAGYAPLAGMTPRYITRRDPRGFAIPLGSTPASPGQVPSPFVDLDGDGLADVNGFGRFIDGQGAELPVAEPFAIPDVTGFASDAFGRPATLVFEYLDINQTLGSAVLRDMLPLLDPIRYTAEGTPQPWLQEKEGLMYALAGLPLLLGPRLPAQYDHASGTIVPEGQNCGSAPPGDGTGAAVPCTSYDRFAAEKSPLVALMHALGPLIGDADSDLIFSALDTLLRDHEHVVARLVGAALATKAMADAHDLKAASGTVPKAELPYEVPVWDEVAQVVSRMAERPGLIAKLLDAMADPVIVSSHSQHPLIPGDKAAHFGQTLARFMAMRDRYSYNRWGSAADINGPAINLTDGYPSLANPHNPVDRTQPLRGENRSMFERSAQLIFDGNGVKACNKNGAKLHTTIVTWPLTGSYGACELFEFTNVGALYLNSTLPSSHPKRAELAVKANDLNALLGFVQIFSSPDALLEASSGINGLTLHPSAPALNRLLFYGADSTLYGKLADFDSKHQNDDINQFVSQAIDPVSGLTCPKVASGVHECSQSAKDEVLRLRDEAVIFGWERLGFYQYLAPQLRVFAELSCNASVTQCDTADYSGETFFLDLVSALWRHWPDKEHGDYCSETVSKNDARYCSGAGINHYEPIIAEALNGDLIPALHAFAKVAKETEITVLRGPNKGSKVRGSEVVEKIVRILFSQPYAKSIGLRDLDGKASAKWVDGTNQAQTTVFSLFADALHQMDTSFDASSDPTAAERKSKWRRARSLLVDAFLGVEGSGEQARFRNHTTPLLLGRVLRLFREQVNAHCPNREASGSCVWARDELASNLSTSLGGPLLAAGVDLADSLNQHEPARRELERFLSYALLSSSGQDALAGMLTSMLDAMQLLQADKDLEPVLQAASDLVCPADDKDGAGALDRGLLFLKAMSGEDYDRYHVLDYVLPALVTPLNNGTGRAPVEVMMDAIADVNRVDSSSAALLAGDDWRFIMKAMREFFVEPTRGFPQLYYIMQNRDN